MEHLLKLKESAENGPENEFNFRVACLLGTLTSTPVHPAFMANCAEEMDVMSIQQEMANTSAKLELDAAEEGLLDLLELAARFECSISLIQRVGPAGGNPLVQVTGALSKLKEFAAEYGKPFDESEFYVEQVQA